MRRTARYAWAQLLARIYAGFPLQCPLCGSEMRIIAFITHPSAMRDILLHLGEPSTPPRMAPARASPLWAMPPTPQPEVELAPPAPIRSNVFGLRCI